MAKMSALPLIDSAAATDEVLVIRPDPNDPTKYETMRMPAGGINADLVPYDDTSSVKDAIDKLLYAASGGLAISDMTIDPAQAEIGATVPVVTLTWALTRDPTAQMVNGAAVADQVHARSATYANVSAATDYTLAVTDANAPGVPATASRKVSIPFLSKGYWGVLSTQAPTDAQLLSLTQALQTSRGRSVAYNASGGGYPIYAWPAAQGDLSGVTVGGLAFTAFTVITRTVVNANGVPVSYKIAVFNLPQTGTSIGVNWA